MSTGEDGAHIGTRYSYYNVQRNVQFCGTSMSSLGKESTVVAKVTKTFPMLDALTKAHILFEDTDDGEQTLQPGDTVVLASGYMVPKSGEEVLRTHYLPSLQRSIKHETSKFKVGKKKTFSCCHVQTH